LTSTPKSRGQVITSLPYPDDLKQYDFVSRVFRSGVEDAVTGSAHCGLAPLWSQRMKEKQQFKAFQASGRGGELDLEIKNEDRVLLTGYAVHVAKGSLHV
jgi:predicted PhzF superfamily epimerase YddE/YHI9